MQYIFSVISKPRNWKNSTGFYASSFEAKLKVYDDVSVLEQGNALSAKISQANVVRSNVLKALVSVVRAYALFPDEEKSEAALNL